MRTLKYFDGKGNEFRVKIPEDSKVTFGPAIPFPRKYDGQSEYALRIYKGATEKSGLLAVFTDVRSFREDSIEVSKLIVREEGKSMWKSDETGYEVSKSVDISKRLLPDEF